MPVNRFCVLPVEEIKDTPSAPKSPKSKDAPTPSLRRPGWERAVPRKPVIRSLDRIGTSLFLSVEIETTDMAERYMVKALLDSGATGSFIDRDFAKSLGLNTKQLS